MLTQARLKELLEYDPETGQFFWLVSRKRARAGDIAGGKNAAGYIQIMIDRVNYYGHRLAYMYMAGEWPELVIDHINGHRYDNRWANLRSVDQRVNGMNRDREGQGTTRLKNGAWVAQISIDGHNVYLGRYASRHEARLAYLATKRQRMRDLGVE